MQLQHSKVYASFRFVEQYMSGYQIFNVFFRDKLKTSWPNLDLSVCLCTVQREFFLLMPLADIIISTPMLGLLVCIQPEYMPHCVVLTTLYIRHIYPHPGIPKSEWLTRGHMCRCSFAQETWIWCDSNPSSPVQNWFIALTSYLILSK